MTDTTAMHGEVIRIRAVYRKAFDRYQALVDADAPAEAIDEAYRAAKVLQHEHISKMRALRHAWDASGPTVDRERITLTPGRCHAMTGIDRQCPNKARYRLGDLEVCKQHYEKIVLPVTASYPDLWDRDGVGHAGSRVLEAFPQPWLWEEMSSLKENRRPDDSGTAV